jgi:hypothetical protein
MLIAEIVEGCARIGERLKQVRRAGRPALLPTTKG